MTDLNAKNHGFTLIELMIVIAIIGILAATAVPQYAQYVKKSKYSEVMSMTAEHKSAVHLCVQELNTLTGCNSGLNGMPASISSPVGYISSLTVVNGLITATGTNELDNAQYILDPTYTPLSNTVSWATSGSCFSANLCSD